MLGVSQETPVAASDGAMFNPGDLVCVSSGNRQPASSLEMIRQHLSVTTPLGLQG